MGRTAVRRARRKEWLKGVPAFQEGGVIDPRTGLPIGQGGQGSPLRQMQLQYFQQGTQNQAADAESLQQIAAIARILGISAEQAASFLQANQLGLGQISYDRMFPSAGGGGGGGDPWG